MKGLSSTATLGCAVFVAFKKTAQPRVAVLLTRLHALGFQDGRYCRSGDELNQRFGGIRVVRIRRNPTRKIAVFKFHEKATSRRDADATETQLCECCTYKGWSGLAIVRHIWATGLPSFPSPSFGCLK